jgi:hypothetical protein
MSSLFSMMRSFYDSTNVLPNEVISVVNHGATVEIKVALPDGSSCTFLWDGTSYVVFADSDAVHA